MGGREGRGEESRGREEWKQEWRWRREKNRGGGEDKKEEREGGVEVICLF